jgi:hypothetical protein
MNIESELEVKLSCKICNKVYASMSSLCNHNKKFHSKNKNGLTSNNNIIPIDNNIILSKKIYNCKYCNKNYNLQQSKWYHEQNCKMKKNNNNELDLEKIKLEQINAEKEKLKEEKEILKIKNIQENASKFDKNLIKLDEMKSIVSDLKLQIKKIEENKEIELNNRFLNIITEKNNIIEEFNNKFQASKENKELVTINQEITEIKSLTFNGVVIVSRSDGFVDATEICKAGGKRFNHWYQLESTKQLFNETASEAGIPASQLMDIKKGNSGDFNQGSWIHPDLAIQLAQWISPSFALQVSKWIRTLFTDSNVSININLQNKLKISNNKIKLLEDAYLRKHKRKDYLETNVIYMVTTEANKNKRNYIIGKTTNLKNRLSTYNKTSEHEVIYYKSCKNESSMNIVESIILNKLDKYREKANRDRFILPLEKDITLFTDIIDDAIKYL